MRSSRVNEYDLLHKPQHWPLPARILRWLSRPPQGADYRGGTETHVGENALGFIDLTVPSFRSMIQGRTVLDYGCGRGHQAVAMKAAGASSVVGYDRFPKWSNTQAEGVRFTSLVPVEKFDVVISCSAFEHFADPAGELATMRSLTRERLVITWAEPWYSHSGSHMNFFTRVPWVNLLFPESAVMQVRSLYRHDGATRYEDCAHGGAVNRMTIHRFERLVRDSGMTVEWLAHRATLGIPFVTGIPVLRELLTSASSCVLRP
jgi:SAM-dependent methyltransferase